jgi:hypothetical protein
MASNRPRTRRTSTRRTTNVVQVAAATPEPETGPAKTLDWQAEYAYVFRDLRQLGIVSVTIFAVLLLAGWLL